MRFFSVQLLKKCKFERSFASAAAFSLFCCSGGFYGNEKVKKIETNQFDSFCFAESAKKNHPFRLLSQSEQEFHRKYSVKEEIGRGGFSVVKLGIEKYSGQEVALKIFDPFHASYKEIEAEIAILKDLGLHKNIISLRDVCEVEGTIIMVSDLVKGGELFDYVVEKGALSEKEASRMLREICLALCHMHDHHICHRDVKPENVLLSSRAENATIKLADFGLSRKLLATEIINVTDQIGTLAYWAPECVGRKPQSFAVDMWAFGLIVYILLTGVHPFDPYGTNTDAEIMNNIVHKCYDESNEWYEALSTESKHLISLLLEKDPAKRLTARDALHHSWLRNPSRDGPLPEGHIARLEAYKRLQIIRANVMAVMVGLCQLGPSDNLSKDESKKRRIIRTTTDNRDMFKQTFDLIDTDDSGYICKTELSAVLSALGQQLSMEEIDAIMKSADTDGDGLISEAEFSSFMNKRMFNRGIPNESDLQKAFKLFDDNGDGFISPEELAHVMNMLGTSISCEDAKMLVDSADKNGDGAIDYSEFASLMSQKSSFRPSI